MDNPTSTLARGQAKSLYREVEYLLNRNIEILAHETASNNAKKKSYNLILKSFEARFNNLIVEKFIIKDKGKHANCIYSLMVTDEIPGRITMDLIHFKKYPQDMEIKRFPACVAKHCIERMFQRLKIQTVDDAVCAINAILYALVNVLMADKQTEEQFEISCAAGIFFGEFHEGTAVVKTFVDDAKLRPEQKIQ